MPVRLDRNSADFDQRFAAFLAAKREVSADVEKATRAIVEDVAARGDAALIEATRKFDRLEIDASGLRIAAAEIDAAVKACDPRTVEALALARDRIETFHKRQMPKDERFTDSLGVELGWRWSAVDAVGLYVPGGTAAYAVRFVNSPTAPITAGYAFTALGSTGLTTSRIGFGGYRIDLEEADHREALIKALREGCNLIDTSTNYGDGDSERLIGAVLAELIPDVIKAFPWPKSQRWGAGDLTWVRPLHSILCTFDGDVVAFEIGGIPPGTYHVGMFHERFRTDTNDPQPVEVTIQPEEKTSVELKLSQ